MADQKELKKRLKVLMNRPENQVCSDCPERQPRWASLIVPPPGAPPGSLPIGAFCCLECSGSHRRLGVHISFVRSVNLDAWKEKEVLAMENGGNSKVNAIFEARLREFGVQKPSNHADGPTRERFIRDKYERRKFYDASAFANLPEPDDEPSPLAVQQASSVGPPSDAARLRLEERRSRMKKTQSANIRRSNSSDDSDGGKQRGTPKRSSSTLTPSSTRRRPVAAAPISAPPPSADLLDFSSDPAPTPAPAPSSGSGNQLDLFDFLTSGKTEPQQQPERTKSPSGSRRAGTSPTKSTISEDIMSLYNNTNTQNAYGNNTGMMNNYGNDMNQMTGMMNNMNFQVMPSAQQQQQQQQQQMMMQQMMMYQQQQMMMQQQQHGVMQQHQQQLNNNNSMMYNNYQQPYGGMSSQNANGFSGTSAAPMGSGPPISMIQFPTQQHQQPTQPQKEDPFAQFGMNVFRST